MDKKRDKPSIATTVDPLTSSKTERRLATQGDGKRVFIRCNGSTNRSKTNRKAFFTPEQCPIKFTKLKQTTSKWIEVVRI